MTTDFPDLDRTWKKISKKISDPQMEPEKEYLT